MERCSHNPYREIFERMQAGSQQEIAKNIPVAPQIKAALADSKIINDLIAFPLRTKETE